MSPFAAATSSSTTLSEQPPPSEDGGSETEVDGPRREQDERREEHQRASSVAPGHDPGHASGAASAFYRTKTPPEEYFRKMQSVKLVNYDIAEDGPITFLHGDMGGLDDGPSGITLPPVRVDLGGESDTVVIRISDRGGGIPPNRVDDVWRYLYTTAKPIRYN